MGESIFVFFHGYLRGKIRKTIENIAYLFDEMSILNASKPTLSVKMMQIFDEF